MSATSNNTIYASNSTDAMFRAWASFIDAAMLLGLIGTADTGQVNLTTVTKPSVVSTSQGYKVYRTNDALTTIYIKIEFGSGTNILYPSVWITVGTNTDGAGTITGTVLLVRTQIAIATSDAATQQLCIASGSAGRVCFALFLSIATGFPIWFSLERRKNSSLAEADTGIIIDYGKGITGHASLCAPFTGIIPTAESGLQFILTSSNPGAYGTTVPIGLRIPCLGSSEPPGLNVALCNGNDFGALAEVTVTVNSVDHVYKQCGPYINTLRGGSTGPYDTATRLMLRYE